MPFTQPGVATGGAIRTSQSILGEEDNSSFGNVLRWLSRPMYAMNSLLTGDFAAAGKNILQMALDLPTGGFLNRNLSLANLVDDEIFGMGNSGDITSKEERPELSTVTYRWGMTPHPDYLTAGERLVLDMGGIVTDPTTYLGGVGLGRGLAAGALKGSRSVFRRGLWSGLGRTEAGRKGLALSAGKVAQDWLGRVNAQIASLGNDAEAIAKINNNATVQALREVVDNAPREQLEMGFHPRPMVPVIGQEAVTKFVEAGGMPRAFRGLQQRAAEETFMDALRVNNPELADIASQTWREFADKSVDAGVAALEKEGLLLNPKEMYWRIPMTETHGKLPWGLGENWWSRIGHYGTAPGWAKLAMERFTPVLDEAVDNAVRDALGWLKGSFYDRTAMFSHLLPEGFTPRVKEFALEEEGLNRQHARRVQQFGGQVSETMAEAYFDEAIKMEDEFARWIGEDLGAYTNLTLQPNAVGTYDGRGNLRDLIVRVSNHTTNAPLIPAHTGALDYADTVYDALWPLDRRANRSQKSKIMDVLMTDTDMAHTPADYARRVIEGSDPATSQAHRPSPLALAIQKKDIQHHTFTLPRSRRERTIFFRKGTSRAARDQMVKDLSTLDELHDWNWEAPFADQLEALAEEQFRRSFHPVQMDFGGEATTPGVRALADRTPEELQGTLNELEAFLLTQQAQTDNLIAQGIQPGSSRMVLHENALDATRRAIANHRAAIAGELPLGTPINPPPVLRGMRTRTDARMRRPTDQDVIRSERLEELAGVNFPMRAPPARIVGQPRMTAEEIAEALDAMVRVGRAEGLDVQRLSASVRNTFDLPHNVRESLEMHGASEDVLTEVRGNYVNNALHYAIGKEVERVVGPKGSPRYLFLAQYNPRMFEGVGTPGSEMVTEAFKALNRYLKRKVAARSRTLKKHQADIVRFEMIERIFGRWANLPEHHNPEIDAAFQQLPLATRGSQVNTDFRQSREILNLLHPGTYRRTHRTEMAENFRERALARFRAERLANTPEGARLYGLAGKLTHAILDDFQKIPSELAGLGIWKDSASANPFYVPHQLDGMFQELNRAALGNPELMDDLQAVFRRPTVRDIFTQRRGYQTQADFVEALVTRLEGRLSNANLRQFAEGQVERTDEMVETILTTIAKNHGINVEGLGLKDIVFSKDILALWSQRMRAHHRTIFRGKTTREAMAFMGLRPSGGLGASQQVPTGDKLRGTVVNRHLARQNWRLNPTFQRYLEFQFGPLDARRSWLQRILGGGTFDVRICSGEGVSGLKRWAQNLTQEGDFFQREVVTIDGTEYARFHWPGLNYFWKPMITSAAIPLNPKNLFSRHFDPRAKAIPLNPAYHIRNSLSALFMATIDPEMSLGGKGLVANVRAVYGTMMDGYILRVLGKHGKDQGYIADFVRWLGDDLQAADEAARRLRASKETFGLYSTSEVMDALAEVLGQRIPLANVRRSLGRDDIAVGLTNMTPLGREVAFNGPSAHLAYRRMVALGSQIAENAETRLRVNGLLSLLDRGVDITEAVKRVNHAFVDYSVNSSVEMWLRDVIPFAKWQLGAVKWSKDIANRPVLVNWMGRIRPSGQDAFAPEDVQDSLALPLGKDREGNVRFLLSLGLPLETTLSAVGIPASTVAMRRQILGSMTPWLKLPAEAVTDKNFFFGEAWGTYRKAPKLLQSLGLADELTLPDGSKRWEIPGEVNEVLSNMPTSRLQSVVDKILDQRKTGWEKALNTLTGVRTKSVDVEEEFKRRLMDYLKEAARRGQAGERLIYFERGFNEEDMPEDLKIVLTSLRDIESEERKARAAQRKADEEGAKKVGGVFRQGFRF